MTRLRALSSLPGPRVYGRAQLGSLPAGDPIIAGSIGFAREHGRHVLSELDRAPAYAPHLHVAGEHASLAHVRRDRGGSRGDSILTRSTSSASPATRWGSTRRSTPPVRSTSRRGTAGRDARPLPGRQRRSAASSLYPIVDDDWLPSAANCRRGRAPCSPSGRPRLDPARRHDRARRRLTPASPTRAACCRRSSAAARYPAQLPLHSAFHTPLMAATADRARGDLADLDPVTGDHAGRRRRRRLPAVGLDRRRCGATRSARRSSEHSTRARDRDRDRRARTGRLDPARSRRQPRRRARADPDRTALARPADRSGLHRDAGERSPDRPRDAAARTACSAVLVSSASGPLDNARSSGVARTTVIGLRCSDACYQCDRCAASVSRW